MDQIIIQYQQWISPFLPKLRDWISLRQVSRALRHFGEHEGCKDILLLSYTEHRKLGLVKNNSSDAKWLFENFRGYAYYYVRRCPLCSAVTRFTFGNISCPNGHIINWNEAQPLMVSGRVSISD